MTTFKRDALPLGDWQVFRKAEPTRMVRIDGPFDVETREGTMSCPDGWLALDTNGDPYPIAADVQASSYEEVPAR